MVNSVARYRRTRYGKRSIMDKLQEKIGYQFRNVGLLQTALTHSSYANEHRTEKTAYNERLEFLGDSILGFVTADYLYRNEGSLPEGKMTRLRAELVCEKSLAAVADELELGRLLRLGKGAEQTGARGRASICADAVEAVLAAVYLDGGISPAREFVTAFILSRIDSVKEENRDWKTELQEHLQKNGAVSLSYVLLEETGPDHDKRFRMAVLLDGKEIGRGEGKSKKAAEQAAARAAVKARKP